MHYGDESGFDEYYSREYGYALRGEPVIGIVSGKHFARTSIVAANFDIAEEYGFNVIFLPPYSPDLNKPIENFWANVKRRLRLHMHKFDTFWDALSHAFI